MSVTFDLLRPFQAINGRFVPLIRSSVRENEYLRPSPNLVGSAPISCYPAQQFLRQSIPAISLSSDRRWILARCSRESVSELCSRWLPPAGQLRTDPNDTQLRHSARRPAFNSCFARKPIKGQGMILVFRYKQRYQHIYIEEIGQAENYASSLRVIRSTSSTVRIGAPERGRNTGTPRSNRTSDSATR